MAKNLYARLRFDANGTDNFVVTAGSKRTVDIDCWKCDNVQFVIQSVYAATASPTGISLDYAWGIGTKYDTIPDGLSLPCVLGTQGMDYAIAAGYSVASGSVIWIGDNTTTYSSMATVTPSSGTTVTTYHWFNPSTWLQKTGSRWLRLIFTNNDASNDVTISIVADM